MLKYKLSFLTFLLVVICNNVKAQEIPGNVAISGSVNLYSKVTAIGGTCPQIFTVADGSKFSVGNKVLIIQHKGATINTNTSDPNFGTITAIGNAGNYEIKTISNIAGNDITFQNDPLRTYDVAGFVQLVTYPEYTGTVTVNGTLNPGQVWDAVSGEGGVITFEANNLILNANIDATDFGFSGGADENRSVLCTDQSHASDAGSNLGGPKGEGIAIDPGNNYYSRNPIGNGGGGGNNHNGGGGGGSNYGAGGLGGESFGNCADCGDNPLTCGIPLTEGQGIGGAALSAYYNATENRLFFGGGGGAGHQNDNVGTGGTNGGGIILIKANTLEGDGNTILSNSLNANPASADGPGASGAGGTVLLEVGNYIGSNLTVDVSAGNGGDQEDPSGGSPDASCYAPGGGGSGGVIWFSQPDMATVNSTVTVTPVVSGGTAGIITNGAAACIGTNNGATDGDDGQVLFGATIPIDQTPRGNGPIPDLGVDINLCITGIPYTLDPGVASGTNINFNWSTGATTSTISINTAGTYSVTVDSAGVCFITDEITVVDDYSIDLGPDRDLCSPISFNLDAGWAGAGGVTYQWQSPPGTNISGGGATNQTYTVTAAGTYRVVVTDPNCGVRTDDIIFTTSTLTPDHDSICVSNGNDVANLAVTGFTNPPDWYDAATGGSLVQAASGTYTTPPLTGTTTFYVENNDQFRSSIGPEAPTDVIDPGVDGDRFIDGSTNEGYGSTNCTGNFIEFTVTNDVILDSVTVYGAYINTTDPVVYTVDILDVSSGCPGTSITGGTGVTNSMTNPYLGMGNNTDIDKPFQLYIGLTLTAGNTYRMILTGGNSQMIKLRSLATDVNVTQANYEITGIVDITARGETWTQAMWPGFFDIIFSSGSQCDRVPVTAYDGGCTLPVEWLNFEATSRKNDVLLEWVTGSEENNDRFIVERSTDGIHWEAIGQINGAGISPNASNYSFTDYHPLSGVSYYRIAQVDFDGSTSFSTIKSVNRKPLQINAVPNPFDDVIHINVVTPNDMTFSLQVVDVNGKTVFSKEPLSANNASVELGKNLAKGVYIVRVLTENEVQTFKVIKN